MGRPLRAPEWGPKETMTLKPSADELKTILEQHSKWRHEEDAGQRANLQDANLQGTILERTPTSPADDASDEAQITAE